MPDSADIDGILDASLDAARRGGPTDLRRSLTLDRDWLDPADSLILEARYRLVPDGSSHRIAACLNAREVFLDEPVRLLPVDIAKPWGREIWFTGIEARGESTVSTPGGPLPLSQYLALAPRRLTGGAPLVLLKILDPRPEPVRGDLYFEVHEQKQEVYVVTRIDPSAWPEGRGGIRFGMNQALRERYRDDARFRHDYLVAVQRYEQIRRAIDTGDGNGAAGDAERLASEEAVRRAAMERFTELRALAVGDVVAVPTWLPHSLQHGVRVVEFQTPTYERYVISFAQQVLTQPHWDSEQAITNMRLDVPDPPRFEAVGDGIERIVAFDDFRVWRITLPAGAAFRVPPHVGYGLCMIVSGRWHLGPLELTAEQAAFVPAAALHGGREVAIVNRSDRTAIALLAAPDL